MTSQHPDPVIENTDAFDQRGQQLVEIEDQYLDGKYDQELFIRRINQYKSVIAMNIYYMGRDLVMLKENCGHGNFLSLLDRMGLTPKAAQQAMRVAAKFNTPKLQQVINGLNSQKGSHSKLLALALETDDDLELLVDGGTVAGLELDDIDRMSATEVRKALRRAKADATADLEAKDLLLQQKNSHADELATKLAKAQALPATERWPEQVELYRKDLTTYGLDAEELLTTVNNLLLSVAPVECPDSARKSMALHSVDLINRLAAACGELQSVVYTEFGEFLNQPTYQISDELTLVDDALETS